MSKLQIVVVGGGSVAWAPNICKDIMHVDAIADSEFVLFDINKKAAELTKAWLDVAAKKLGRKATFTATDNQAAALKGADYIIIAISTGGLDAMAYDLSIPQKFGILHTVGDTSGPGGWSRLIRNFDVFVDLGLAINKYAPKAVVLNYTNPMTTLTDVLSRICKGPVVGLCHGLFESLRFLKDYYKVQSEDDIAVKYGVINHFFWITEARVKGRDVIADLKKKLQKQSFTDLLAKIHKDEMGYSSPKREVATELIRLTGAMPYLGDRHTCEFFSQYITSEKNMKKYKIIRTSIATRRKNFKGAQARVKRDIRNMADDRLRRSRETAADIINAHSQGKVFIDVGNVPNIGQMANLPLGSVVETAVRVDANGFSPIAFGELPETARSFVEPYCSLFNGLVDACFEGNRFKALQMLRQDPVCAGLTGDQVLSLGEKLLGAHKKFIKCF